MFPLRIRLITLSLLVCLVGSLQAQDEEDRGGFRKENIFIGTSLNLGVSSGVFQIGANPEIGYSLARWLDGGVSTNINYTSFRYTDGTSDRYFVYGAGPFLRLWPVRFLFVTAQPEFNRINITRKYSNGLPSDKYKFNATSFLLGAGYGNRVVGQTYSYIAIMFDAMHDINSPYRDEYDRIIPIFRAGFALYLRPKSER